MDRNEPPEGQDVVAERRSAHEHSEHLRRRIEGLASEIAVSEDTVAAVYEQSARLRPHAAERLREGARHAREYAARERAYVAEGAAGGTTPS